MIDFLKAADIPYVNAHQNKMSWPLVTVAGEKYSRKAEQRGLECNGRRMAVV